MYFSHLKEAFLFRARCRKSHKSHHCYAACKLSSIISLTKKYRASDLKTRRWCVPRVMLRRENSGIMVSWTRIYRRLLKLRNIGSKVGTPKMSNLIIPSFTLKFWIKVVLINRLDNTRNHSSVFHDYITFLSFYYFRFPILHRWNKQQLWSATVDRCLLRLFSEIVFPLRWKSS